jgi:acyl carrier protein
MQPDRAAVVSSVIRFLRQETQFKDEGMFNEDTPLLEAGVVDSLMVVQLVAHCETEFDCQIDMDTVSEETLANPGRIAALVLEAVQRSRQSGASPP